MVSYWIFEKFLRFAESHGWKLERISGQNRVFKYMKDSSVPRFVCPIHDGKVSIEYVERFKRIVREVKGGHQGLEPSI